MTGGGRLGLSVDGALGRVTESGLAGSSWTLAKVSPAVYVRRSGHADGGLAGGAGTSPARPGQPAYLAEMLTKKRRSPKSVYGYGQTCKPCSMLRPPPSSFTGALDYPSGAPTTGWSEPPTRVFPSAVPAANNGVVRRFPSRHRADRFLT